MSADGDDLRYRYSEEIGNTILLSTTVAAVVTPELAPGRYELRIIDFNSATDVYVRQVANVSELATAAAPNLRFRGHATVAELNKPLMRFVVKGSTSKKFITAIAVGATAAIEITKISRGPK